MDIQVIDAHQHLWDSGRFAYSWMEKFPSIRGRRLIDEYRGASAGIDVCQSVCIDADVDDEHLAKEAEMIFALADDPRNSIGGVVASVQPEQPHWLEHLRRFLEHPKLKGVRRVLHSQPDDLADSALFVDHIESLGALNLSFDLCVRAEQLPVAARLVRRCPGVSFILDHCGNPDVLAGRLDPWREAIEGLAQEPNVSCKISGLMTRAGSDFTASSFKPYVDQVIRCFGWDRVLWGSDWPVCTLGGSIDQWYHLSLESLVFPTREQLEKILRDNAIRVYRLEGSIHRPQLDSPRKYSDVK